MKGGLRLVTGSETNQGWDEEQVIKSQPPGRGKKGVCGSTRLKWGIWAKSSQAPGEAQRWMVPASGKERADLSDGVMSAVLIIWSFLSWKLESLFLKVKKHVLSCIKTLCSSEGPELAQHETGSHLRRWPFSCSFGGPLPFLKVPSNSQQISQFLIGFFHTFLRGLGIEQIMNMNVKRWFFVGFLEVECFGKIINRQ